MPTTPPQLPSDGILIGYSLEHERRTAPIGFVYGETRAARSAAAPAHLAPILHTGGGHLMTIAPTGAGKGVSCIIPTLLRFAGPVIVIDPKGENYAVTAERRRALGQTVVLLDPMGITGVETSALNPLDLIDADEAQSIDDASMLASLLSGGVEKDDPRNLFWYQRGEALLTGLIQYVATEAREEKRNLSEVRRILNLPNDEFMAFSRQRLTAATDADVRQIAGTLINPAEEMIGSIVGMSQNSLGFLRGELLHRATARSSFDLDGVTRGDPISIFIVIPPDKLRSHQNLLRVWVGTLMAALMRRRAPVDHNTLFILDEAAQLGPLEQLRQAITLLRGYGLQTWSFWQDHSQLRNLYPLDWQTMYNNSRVHQAFGFATLQAAEAITQLNGFHDPLAALQLDADEMLLSIAGDETVIAQKPNYLADPAFSGLFSENPFYAHTHSPRPAARDTQRVYRRPKRQSGGTKGGTTESSTGDEADGAARTDGSSQPSGTGDASSAPDSFEARLAEVVLEPRDRPRVFAPQLSDEPYVPAPLLVPGGLSPLPFTQLLDPGELTQLLDRIEAAIGDRWDRYRSFARSLIIAFDPTGPVIYDVVAPLCSPMRAMYVDLGGSLRRWTGGPRDILALTGGDPPVLAGGAGLQYARLLLQYTRGPALRLCVVETVPELAYVTNRAADELQGFSQLVRDLEMERDEQDRRVAVGTALSGADLVAFRLRLQGADAPALETIELVRESVGALPERVWPRAGDTNGADPHAHNDDSWEVMGEPDLTDLLSWLDPREVADLDLDEPVLRRRIACYPAAELVRVAPEPDRDAALYLWFGGQPLRLRRGTLLAVNASHLRLDGTDALIAYARLYAWLRFDEEYRIAVLDRAEDLAGLVTDEAGLDESMDMLRERWVPMTVESIDEDGGGTLAFTVLLDDDVFVMVATIGAAGDIDATARVGLLESVPIDFDRLRSRAAFPILGDITR